VVEFAGGTVNSRPTQGSIAGCFEGAVGGLNAAGQLAFQTAKACLGLTV